MTLRIRAIDDQHGDPLLGDELLWDNPISGPRAPEVGAVCDGKAAARSWNALNDFLEEISHSDA